MLSKPHEDDDKISLSRIKNRRYVTDMVTDVLTHRDYLVDVLRKKQPRLTLDIKDDVILHASLIERMEDLIEGAQLVIERCRLSHMEGRSYEWTTTYLQNLLAKAVEGVKDEDCSPT